MKTIKSEILKATIALMVILWVPLGASAADMWAETPDLNSDIGISSFIVESHTFKYKSPEVDMWAKTPNLDAEREDHGVRIDGKYRFISNINSEMYAETPDLHNILPSPQPETMESTLLAIGK